MSSEYKNNTNTISYGLGSGKVGVYYNYCAASGGTYCYTSSNGVGNASYDICPACWRMPTGGINGKFQTLLNRYEDVQDASNTNSLQYNLSVVLSGWFPNTTSPSAMNLWGHYWSSSRYNERYMYRMDVNASSVSPQMSANGNGRKDGFSIRCLANNP